MNIIYLLFHGLSPYSGISKKILYQVKGLEACGHQVSLCTYCIADNSHRVRMINGEIIADYGTGKLVKGEKKSFLPLHISLCCSTSGGINLCTLFP